MLPPPEEEEIVAKTLEASAIDLAEIGELEKDPGDDGKAEKAD